MHGVHRRHHHSGSQSGTVPQAYPAGSRPSTQSTLRDPPGQAPRRASAIRGVSWLSRQLGQDAVPSASRQGVRPSLSNSVDSSSVREGSAHRSPLRITHRQNQFPSGQFQQLLFTSGRYCSFTPKGFGRMTWWNLSPGHATRLVCQKATSLCSVQVLTLCPSLVTPPVGLTPIGHFMLSWLSQAWTWIKLSITPCIASGTCTQLVGFS